MTAEEEQVSKKREIDELLARTRKSIAESRALVQEAGLRVAETDRFLASYGLTRNQVMGMRFTREQKMAVNEELRRRGLPPFEDDEGACDFATATAQLAEDPPTAADDNRAERSRKFGTFMQNYRI